MPCGPACRINVVVWGIWKVHCCCKLQKWEVILQGPAIVVGMFHFPAKLSHYITYFDMRAHSQKYLYRSTWMVRPSFGLRVSVNPITVQIPSASSLNKWKWFRYTIVMNLKWNTAYPCVQCAAVMTHCSLMRVPPQKTLTLPPFGFDLVKATCQPISPSTAGSPPTILWILSSTESRSVANRFWPQTAMIWWHLFSCGWYYNEHLATESYFLNFQLTALSVSPMQES